MPGRSQQPNRKLKRLEQSCSKLTDLFKKSRTDNQSSTNENVDDVTVKNMQEESRKQKRNYTVFFKSLSAF